MKNALVSASFDFSFQKPVYWLSEILVFFLILEVLNMQSSRLLSIGKIIARNRLVENKKEIWNPHL